MRNREKVSHEEKKDRKEQEKYFIAAQLSVQKSKRKHSY